MKQPSELSTTRRELILMFLFQYQANKYPPSIREIKDFSGITSTSVVNYYLDKLAKDGYIRREPKISRGTFLLPAGESKARSLLGIKQSTHCEHCTAPVGKDGKYKPHVPTKIQKKNRHSVYPTAA